MLQRLRQFIFRQEGVAAVEFALIAPFMVALFIGMVELGDAMIVKRKVTSMTSSVADLVGRAKAISDTDITNVFNAAGAIMSPFDSTKIKMRITSIEIALDGTQTVGWSDATANETPLAQGATIVLPEGLGVNGGSIIKVEASYTHKSLLGNLLPTDLTFDEQFFTQPRKILKISRL